MNKLNIRSFTKDELESFFMNVKEKKFRASQVFNWVWKNNVSDFYKMNNIPFSLRSKLDNLFYFSKTTINSKQISSDQTIKLGFKLSDGVICEGVLIPSKKRITACISSQVGCSLSCAFCATGKLKRLRNISAEEIYDQVYHIKKISEKEFKKNLTNIVYMGMGEPLLNYKNVIRSIQFITSKEGLAISPKRITVSTSGIVKMINKLADDCVKFNLALSLHAANNEKRSQIMPINNSNNLESLKSSLQYFNKKTNRLITLEYIIFKDFNDSIDDAKELIIFAKDLKCKINIIEYNNVEGLNYNKASEEKTNQFKFYLEKRGLIVNVRKSRGEDIDAACGQLANKA